MNAPLDVAQLANLIGCDHEPAWLAEDRAYRQGRADSQTATRRDLETAEILDVDQPGDWPVRQLGPLPKIDPDLDRRRYPPHGRKRFAEPRPGDYPGGRLPLEKPGLVWLAGSVVHHHRCEAACRNYRPGWYRPADAARILSTLPGDHTDAIKRLTALAARQAA